MKVAIVGYEVEGRSAYAYWHKQGADITICDQDPAKVIPSGVPARLGEDYLERLDKFDVIVRTPGLQPRLILDRNPDVADKITTVVDEFLRVCPTKHTIGITGTKGKGTTATLITRMLEISGRSVFLGGNIGVPPLDFLDKLDEESWVVLELSSYQLADIRHSTAIAVCLMVAPEHLNWHADMDEYVLSKSHLFEHQEYNGLAIYYAQNDLSKKIASYSHGLKMPYFASPGAYIRDGAIVIDNETVCSLRDIKLLGEHNWQNICAAVTVVWQIVPSITEIRSVLTTFTGLEHRLEFVREVDQVKYYNDSYASAPDATIAALSAITDNTVMIMGGFDRNLPLEGLAAAAREHTDHLRKVVLIGASSQRLAQAFGSAGFVNYVIEPSKEMASIIEKARSFALPGDSIVLSPGFPSFDMFKNFTDRGLQYKAIIEQL
ncbi:MAG TPA: UDP-N-acetylmuramoyl-L-alanine--D-glutamate ligase [Candidatus Saccharimonadales bacterium]|nr:UDP-N-acetylmuramoyl-L-alanine--D-glutamate ligase [Candidatus Saccharimonadales bacterium]